MSDQHYIKFLFRGALLKSVSFIFLLRRKQMKDGGEAEASAFLFTSFARNIPDLIVVLHPLKLAHVLRKDESGLLIQLCVLY